MRSIWEHFLDYPARDDRARVGGFLWSFIWPSDWWQLKLQLQQTFKSKGKKLDRGDRRKTIKNSKGQNQATTPDRGVFSTLISFLISDFAFDLAFHFISRSSNSDTPI